MKFNIDNYKGKYVMHCKTEEEAREFAVYMDTIGKPLTCSLKCYYGKNVSFFNDGTWGDKAYAIRADYTILEWEDFMKEFTKADLKTGDVVQRRNGSVEIVNCELKTLICKRGWNDLDDTREDLTDKQHSDYDIVAVRRPKEKGDCQFDAFGCKHGTLVYERKEVEEMTLAEVCKLLGKEIKIIK
jgi:hypothetical protein